MIGTLLLKDRVGVVLFSVQMYVYETGEDDTCKTPWISKWQCFRKKTVNIEMTML